MEVRSRTSCHYTAGELDFVRGTNAREYMPSMPAHVLLGPSCHILPFPSGRSCEHEHQEKVLRMMRSTKEGNWLVYTSLQALYSLQPQVLADTVY